MYQKYFSIFAPQVQNKRVGEFAIYKINFYDNSLIL